MAGTYQLAIIVNGEADGVVELGDDITAIGSSAQGAESSVRGFFDGINQGAGGVSNVAAQMAGLDTAIGSAAQAWNAGEVASQSFASALDANIDGINAVGRMLGQLSTAINDTTPAPVVDAFNQLNTAYGAHNAALQETFTDWNKVNAAMADIRTSVGTLDQALAQTGQAAGNAGQGIGALDQSLGTVNQATTHAAQGFAGFAQSLGTAVDGGVARVKSGIAGLEQVVSATAQPFAGLGQAIGSGLSTATQKVSGFAQSIGSSIGGGLSTAAQSVTGWAQSVGSSITSGLSSIPNQLANVGGQIKGFFSGFQASLGRIGEIAIGAFREIGAVAINALGAAAGAVGGFLKDSVSIAGDFEAGMNQFQAAAGDSLAAAGLSVDDFKNKFLELGATLPVSTSAVQEAATTLIKGGLDPMVVKMGGLESSLKFAAAAGMDLNSAAELSIKNLGTFVPITATAAEQTQFLADSQNLLVKAAGASTLDVDKLGAAMLAAGGQAKASGVDYQDFVTTMGMISPSFDSAATAGTSYKNFLARLQPTTKSAMDAMTSLNLVTADGKSKFFDATGAFVGNREAAAMLQKSLAGLSDAQRTAALQAIFGNDAMGAAVALANSGAAGYDKFAAAMANASGVEQTAKTVQQGFNIALDNMHGSIEALQIVVGTALLPALTYLLNTVISPGINLVTQFAQAVVGGGDALAGLPPILQSVVGFFESLWNAEGAVEAAFISAGTNSLAFGAALDQLGVALGLPMGLLSGISFAIQDFIAMVYPAADAIGAFFMSMGSGMDVFALTLTLMDVFGATVGGIITDAVVMLRNYAQVWIDLGTTIFNVVAALIGGDLAGAWAALTGGIAQVVADYQVYAASLGTLLMSLATTIGQAVLTWGAALVDWIAPYIPIALAALGAFVSAAWTWIQEQAPGWLVTLGSWGQALVDWATPYLSLAITTLSTWLAGLWTWIQEQAPGWLTTLGSWGMALVDWATPYLSLALTTLSTWVGGLWAWVQEQAPGWIAQLSAWGTALAEWIGPAIPPALAALGGLIGSLLSWAGGQLGALLSAFGAWAAPLIAWIPGAITSFLAEWPAMLSGWLDTFASWAGPLLAQLATLGASIIGWVATQAGPLLAQLAVWGVQFVAWIAPMIPPVLAGLLGLAGAIVVFIAQTAGVILAKVVEWGAAMLGWVKTDVLPKLPGILDDIKKSINTWASTAVDAVKASVKSIGTGIVDGIRDGVSSAWGKFTKWIGDQMAKIPAPIRDALGMHSPSRVMAQLVGLPIVQGIGAGFEQGLPKVASTIASGAKEIVRSATSALAGTGAPASAGDMLAGLNDFVTEFLATAQSFSMKAVRGAQGFADTVGKILAVIGPAVEALGSLRTMVAPTHESVNAFGAALAYVLGEMIVTTYSFGKKSIAATAVFAENVGKILAPISTAVDAFAKLKDLVTPTHESVNAFRAALQYVLGEMIVTTYSFGPKSIAASAVFAESVGKIMGVIGPAVDAFAKLPDLVVPSHAAVSQFGQTLRTVVAMMRAVSESAKIEFVQAAATFAESAGKMIAIIGPGVDGFSKLAEFGGVPARNITLFGVALRQAVGMLFAIGRAFKAESVVAAAVFAEGAGKAVGMIGAASESMTKLKDFVAPSQAAFAAFGASLRTALATLIGVMKSFTADAIAAAGVFGEGAGKAVAFIGNAVDGFTKLKDFVAPTMGAIGSFGITLRATLTTLMQVMDAFAVDAVAAAGKFGEGAGKAVSFIGNAVGSFAKLKDFQNIPQEAILMFVDNLWRVFEELEQASENFTPAGYAAAKSLYEGIGESMSVIGKAVDGIAKLKDMTNIPQATVLLFVDNLWRVFEELEQASENFTPAGYAAAKSLSDGIGESMSVIGKAIDGFLKLKEFEAVPQKTILAFVDTLWRVFEELEQASENFTAAGYAAAKSLNDGIGTSMSVIGRAVESFAKLAEFTAPAPKAIGSFGQALRAVLTELNAVAGVFSADAVAITATFATNVNTIVSQVKGALQSFASLDDAKVGGDVLKSFMASAQSLVGQMNSYLPPNALIVGQNTVIGLINGIVSQRGALVTAMVNTVMAAVIAARQTLGIASPSKVFEQIGQYAGAGLQGGMAAMQPAIAATSAGLGISAVNATTSALRPSGGGTTNNNQRSVVIEAGAIVINGAGGNPRATADAVATELQRRIGMQGT